ncbi:cupin domain-containing protein [Deminuibacter soli]|uniref:Cupin domain-containing protein n=1 Tax=Deminuibacter soli TaxID=2291815 RepID=A0A3E1NIF1_9BACT|nr:cupin domain-containing protein [Deminuibacter soli]RFM27702.1 cupin domain-containing protein [Deminuibacter soli]
MIQELITTFQLLPHPEGGYYKETYRSAGSIAHNALPPVFGGDRSYSTAIYFLLEQGNFSAFHRIESDELWHFYAGGSLLVHVLNPAGELHTIKLGADIANGETFQAVVPAGSWFASETAPGTSFSFVGCTVAPGFDFSDFELAKANVLSAAYPQYTALIERLCRQ